MVTIEQVATTDRILGEDNERIRYNLEFSASKDVTYVQRVVYNLFMLLGDVGGLSGSLTLVSTVLVSLFTFKNADNHLVQILFDIPSSTSSDQDDREANKNEIQKLDHTKQHALKEWCQSLLPESMLKWVCMRRNRHDKLFI